MNLDEPLDRQGYWENVYSNSRGLGESVEGFVSRLVGNMIGTILFIRLDARFNFYGDETFYHSVHIKGDGLQALIVKLCKIVGTVRDRPCRYSQIIIDLPVFVLALQICFTIYHSIHPFVI